MYCLNPKKIGKDLHSIMKILIIRHGDPDYSVDSLTEKGFREADLLSERLCKIPIDDFYCSPLGRAMATAEPTLQTFGKTAEILDWLQEFRGRITSPFTGEERISWDLPPSLWCNDATCYGKDDWSSSDILSGGTAKKIYDETTAGMDALLSRYGWKKDGMAYLGGEDKTIALFCHFGLGITIVAYLLGISPIVAQNNFFLAPTSVTTLVTETDKKGYSHFRAIGVSDISHLYAANEPMSLSGLHPNFEK